MRYFSVRLEPAYLASVRKFGFNFPDKRDHFLVKFLTNHGFFKARFAPECSRCGQPNSRRHAINECPAADQLRTRTLRNIAEITKVPYRDLEGFILLLYFRPSWDDKTMYKLVEEVKRCLACLWIDCAGERSPESSHRADTLEKSGV